jgi:hypothetical protein
MNLVAVCLAHFRRRTVRIEPYVLHLSFLILDLQPIIKPTRGAADCTAHYGIKQKL